MHMYLSMDDTSTKIHCVLLIVQMYVNALIKRAGIFAGQQNMDKCRTCLEKASALCPDSIDVLVHRARVSNSKHTDTTQTMFT